MKNKLTKIFFTTACLVSFLVANENIDSSLKNMNITKSDSNSYSFDKQKNVIKTLRRNIITKVAKKLNLDPKLFDDREKFSLYLRIASTSKIGFKYRF